MNRNFDILIVGGGPAGLAAWLFLHEKCPELASRTILIEKSVYPRTKICGGGISTPGRHVLSRLSLDLNFSYNEISHLEIILEKSYILKAPEGFIIVNRNEFDSALAENAKERGLIVHESESFIDLKRKSDHLIVYTDKTSYRVKSLVGADGVRSAVRKKIHIKEQSRLSSLYQQFLKIVKNNEGENISRKAIFDFTPLIKSGLQGYVWCFPGLSKEGFYNNVGIYDSRIYRNRKTIPVENIVRNSILNLLSSSEIKSFKNYPLRYFSSEGIYSQPHVILTGEAAGVEPALGEGISVSLNFGDIASQALVDAFREKDFSFRNYNSRILQHKLGLALQNQVSWAKLFYSNNNSSLHYLHRYFGCV
jgi:flavin-dependent dehydrogenase